MKISPIQFSKKTKNKQKTPAFAGEISKIPATDKNYSEKFPQKFPQFGEMLKKSQK